MKDLFYAILANNGASVNYRGQIVQLRSGYQVSKRDLGRVMIEDMTEQLLADIVYSGLKRGEYAGFWVEDGYLYADISVRVSTKAKAFEQGKLLNQISVLRWRDMVCLYL